MRLAKLVLLALIFVAAHAPVASAQMQWEFTPFAGYYIASDLYNAYSPTGPGQARVGLTDSFLWGGRLTGTRGHAGLEFAYTRTGSDVQLENLLAGQPRKDVGRINIDSFDLNFLGFQQTGNPNVLPFGEIGLGFSVLHPKIDDDALLGGTAEPESRTRFNFNFGLGTKILVSERIGLRFEGRWRVTDTNVTTGSTTWCDAWGYCYSYSTDWYNSGELIGGLSYRF